MNKILSKGISSKTYCLGVSKESALLWDEWERNFPHSTHEHLKRIFPSFIEYEFDLMFGAFIWVTVSDDSEMEAIIEFIEQRI